MAIAELDEAEVRAARGLDASQGAAAARRRACAQAAQEGPRGERAARGRRRPADAGGASVVTPSALAARPLARVARPRQASRRAPSAAGDRESLAGARRGDPPRPLRAAASRLRRCCSPSRRSIGARHRRHRGRAARRRQRRRRAPRGRRAAAGGLDARAMIAAPRRGYLRRRRRSRARLRPARASRRSRRREFVVALSAYRNAATEHAPRDAADRALHRDRRHVREHGRPRAVVQRGREARGRGAPGVEGAAHAGLDARACRASRPRRSRPCARRSRRTCRRGRTAGLDNAVAALERHARRAPARRSSASPNSPLYGERSDRAPLGARCRRPPTAKAARTARMNAATLATLGLAAGDRVRVTPGRRRGACSPPRSMPRCRTAACASRAACPRPRRWAKARSPSRRSPVRGGRMNDELARPGPGPGQRLASARSGARRRSRSRGRSRSIVLVLVPVLLTVLYYQLVERWVIGWIQVRKGPNRVGWKGVLQPIADAIKLLMKEQIVPDGRLEGAVPARARSSPWRPRSPPGRSCRSRPAG